jgi:hypothetical protein
MLFAEEAAKATTSTYSGFDPFIIIFTIIIAAGLIRLFRARKKNLFAIGFSAVALIVFLIMDVIAIKGW